MNQETLQNFDLEACLPAAFEGRKDAIEAFFRAFAAGPLFVPDRVQGQPLSDQPVYPTDFVNVLGIQDQERVVVPCFSRPEMIEAWCGLPLSYSTLDGITVAKRIPENWWVVVNPGQEIEKELSPWEIEKLSQGSEAIPELLLDIVPENSIEPLTLLPVEEHEFVKLKQALANAAPQEPMLESIFLAKEQGLQEDGETIEQLLIGMAWNQGATPDLQGPFEHLIQTAMIGDSTYALYSSLTESGSMRIGMLRKFSPLYQRNEETKLRKIFNKLLG